MNSEHHQAQKRYKNMPLDRESLCLMPLDQFGKWLGEAGLSQVAQPESMHLATVSAEKEPSLRTVLMKYFDHEGLVFFTNYDSQKAEEIAVAPKVSALFFWKELERQVEFTGRVEKISSAESNKYFATRPRESQLGAWASPQSSIIDSRESLERELKIIREKFLNRNVPLPNNWGGFKIIPHIIEFWQGRPDRLHDRFEYRLENSGDWSIVRLAP